MLNNTEATHMRQEFKTQTYIGAYTVVHCGPYLARDRQMYRQPRDQSLAVI